MRCLDGTTDSRDMSLNKLWERVKNREATHASVHGGQRIKHDLAVEHQLDDAYYKNPKNLKVIRDFSNRKGKLK